MSNKLLPSTRHIKELIEHAEEHIYNGAERDLKISLIHADNSIEILLKEYLRYNKQKPWRDIENNSFYKLLNDSKDIILVKDSMRFFLAYHDLRNAVYHFGTLIPSKDDVQSALNLAKTLFNVLHPSLKFVEVNVDLPSSETMDLIASFTVRKGYVLEVMVINVLKTYFKNLNYEVLIQPWKTNGIMADFVASKNDKMIVVEITSVRSVRREKVLQLNQIITQVRIENPDKNIEGWIITSGKFSKSTENIAKEYNYKLFDAEKFEKEFGYSIEGKKSSESP